MFYPYCHKFFGSGWVNGDGWVSKSAFVAPILIATANPDHFIDSVAKTMKANDFLFGTSSESLNSAAGGVKPRRVHGSKLKYRL